MERSKIRLGGISDKSIHYRHIQVMASMPEKQKPIAFMDGCFRIGCWPWWKYWLNPKSYIRAVSKYWHRARYGYDREDLYSLDDYLATWMPYAVRSCTWHILYYTKQGEREKQKFYYMIVGWEALWHLGWNCECYDTDIHGMKHDEYWQKRYAYCMPYFEQYMRRLWW